MRREECSTRPSGRRDGGASEEAGGGRSSSVDNACEVMVSGDGDGRRDEKVRKLE